MGKTRNTESLSWDLFRLWSPFPSSLVGAAYYLQPQAHAYAIFLQCFTMYWHLFCNGGGAQKEKIPFLNLGCSKTLFTAVYNVYKVQWLFVLEAYWTAIRCTPPPMSAPELSFQPFHQNCIVLEPCSGNWFMAKNVVGGGGGNNWMGGRRIDERITKLTKTGAMLYSLLVCPIKLKWANVRERQKNGQLSGIWMSYVFPISLYSLIFSTCFKFELRPLLSVYWLLKCSLISTLWDTL